MKQTDATRTTVKVVSDLLRELPATPFVSGLLGALARNDVMWLSQIESYDLDSEMFHYDYFARSIIRKYPFLGLDRKKEALDTFEKYEEHCRLTNLRLNADYRGTTAARDRIFWLREEISMVLGRFNWDEAERYFAHGPGATTRVPKRDGDAYFKFRGKPETTFNNMTLAATAVCRVPLWFGEIRPLNLRDMFTVVAGSRVTTVPKNMKTDRTIAIEPCMNMFIQKGIGRMIRNRLRRVGIDLNDQSINQRLAARAQKDCLATIDLSSASDTVSVALVELLLPDDWLQALKQCRSDKYVYTDGSVKHFQKFSTMGNGFTFELESLIFWAISELSVAETFAADKTVSVFGDDIIVPEYAAERCLELLEYFGFVPNRKKSFTKGPFRESCGKHYFNGQDVTPVYVDDRCDTQLRLVWLANSIVRWGDRVISADKSVVLKMWKSVYTLLDDKYRLSIPDGVGDGGLVYPTSLLPASPIAKAKSKASSYQGGFDYSHFVDSKMDLRDRDPTDVPYLLRQLYMQRDGHLYRPLTRCNDMVFVRMPISRGRDKLVPLLNPGVITRTFSFTKESDSEPSSVLNSRRVVRVRSWCNSWPTNRL